MRRTMRMAALFVGVDGGRKGRDYSDAHREDKVEPEARIRTQKERVRDWAEMRRRPREDEI